MGRKRGPSVVASHQRPTKRPAAKDEKAETKVDVKPPSMAAVPGLRGASAADPTVKTEAQVKEGQPHIRRVVATSEEDDEDWMPGCPRCMFAKVECRILYQRLSYFMPLHFMC